MKYWKHCFALIMILVLLAACQAQPAVTVNTPTAEQNAAALPTALPGKSTLTGKIFDKNGNPLAETPLRLATIYRQGDQGAFLIEAAHSPGTISEADGSFTFADVPPAEYLIVAGWLEANIYTIYQDENAKPFTYILAADQTLDVGAIQVDLPK